MRVPGARLAAIILVVALAAAVCTTSDLTTAGSSGAVADAGVQVSMPARESVGDCTLENPQLIGDDSGISNHPFNRLTVASLWRHATGKGVVVAVVDSGVQAGNAHFPEDSLLSGYSNVPGYPDPRESVTLHGTAVAGIIAAREIRGSTVVGVAPDAQILPVRVFASEESPYVEAGVGPRADRIAEGIRWAADNHADVIAVSMSTPNPSSELDDAVEYATSQGALVVASAGNNEDASSEESPPVHDLRWPAASPGALGVTAANLDDDVTNYSIHGRHVDVVAPGTHVLSAYHDAGDCPFQYDREPFTSLATPFVAGAAALLMDKYPHESPAEIAYRLEASADRPVRNARDDVRGWGFIRPLEALTMTIDPARPGPPVPGRRNKGRAEAIVADVPALSLEADPLAPARANVAWWLMLGAGLVLLMVILVRWRALAVPREPRRRRRSREVSPAGHGSRSATGGGGQAEREWADAPHTARVPSTAGAAGPGP